jgi:hypothetical protein
MKNESRYRSMRSQVLALGFALGPILVHAQGQGASLEERFRVMEERLAQMEQEAKKRDELIKQLQGEPHPTPVVVPAPQSGVTQATDSLLTSSVAVVEKEPASGFGEYTFGKGVTLARNSWGEVNFSLITYVRYLNQMDLEPTFTDSFGRTKEIDRREDIQLNKVTLTFKGWMFDESFQYLAYIWTANATQGQGAQVAVAGNLSYKFNDMFTLAGGVGALPTTRSTLNSYPNWLRVDNRTAADEFMRGSFTNGVWLQGEAAENLHYRVMVAQNLSILGVDGGQLTPGLNTYSGGLWWMPTTGEFGPAMGVGDFEGHQEVATLFGGSFTRSREDAESQPGVNAFENSQLKLSDGTRIFQPDAFNTGGQINSATYQMASMHAGVKYRGWSLETEFYRRWINNFDVTGIIPVTELNDSGFQVQASFMAIPKTLQFYVSGSKIFGEYGDPYDVALGGSWFPLKRREVRANVQALYMKGSPVGYLSVPMAVGANGWIFTTDFVLAF